MDADLSKLPRRRSLALWASLALVMVAASYALIVVMALVCAVVLPYFLASSDPGIQTLILIVIGIGIGGTMIWSILPRRDNFKPPGPLLDPASHPLLFAELENIARYTNEPLPGEVYLVPQVNAFVTDRGGIMGFGSRRVMGIGLPLVAVLNVSEFRAVLAHEFAHFYGGDTRLGPFVYKTRMAMLRTIQNLLSIRGIMRIGIAQILYRLVMAILQIYWKFFLRVTQMVSRRQEFRADEIACHIAGSHSLTEGLKKIQGASASFMTYWNSEVVPVLNRQMRPSVAEGFAMFVSAPEIVKQIDEVVNEALKNNKSQVYDSHPPLPDRIAAAESIRNGTSIAETAPAYSLFGDLLGEEKRLLQASDFGSKLGEMKIISWDDLPALLPDMWRKAVKEHASYLGDTTADTLPDILDRLPVIGSRIPDPKGILLTPEQRSARAANLFGLALSLMLNEAGWPLYMKPGFGYFEVGTMRVSVRQLISGLISKKISKEEWATLCQTFKIAGQRLNGATRAKTAFEA